MRGMHIISVLGLLITATVVWLYLIQGARSDDCTVLRKIQTDNGLVEIVNATCKEGLPHTTGPQTMRFTEAAWNDARREETLVHERVHLAQKRAPTDWAEFYRRVWDYEMFTRPPVTLPDDSVMKLRKNPDTEDAPWAVWRHRYVFYPYSADGKLKSATVRIWDLELKTHIESPPDAWRAFFCDGDACPHQYEHPHELAAEYIAKKSNSQAAANLFAWYK
jgi:hypothetical protein